MRRTISFAALLLTLCAGAVSASAQNTARDPPIAAVYAHGSSFGPANEVADIMNRRVAKMAAFRAIASISCNATNKGTDKPATVAALAASKHQGGGWGSNMPISTAQTLENLRGECSYLHEL